MIYGMPNSKPVAGKRSTGVAMLLGLVAIMGMLMIFNNPPGEEYDKAATENDQVVQDEQVEQVEQVDIVEASPIQTNYGWYFFRMILITGMLIVLFVFGAKFYKKKMTKSDRYFDMRVLGKQYISAKQYLMMVKVEEKKLLLGVTDNSIQMLKEYPVNSEEDETEVKIKSDEKFGNTLSQMKI